MGGEGTLRWQGGQSGKIQRHEQGHRMRGPDMCDRLSVHMCLGVPVKGAISINPPCCFPMEGKASQAVGRQWALAQELAVVHNPQKQRKDWFGEQDGPARGVHRAGQILALLPGDPGW